MACVTLCDYPARRALIPLLRGARFGEKAPFPGLFELPAAIELISNRLQTGVNLWPWSQARSSRPPGPRGRDGRRLNVGRTGSCDVVPGVGRGGGFRSLCPRCVGCQWPHPWWGGGGGWCPGHPWLLPGPPPASANAEGAADTAIAPRANSMAPTRLILVISPLLPLDAAPR